jgi:murein DD-endopeptidase MepM/ murein hydrolase activator NlpD
VVLHGTHDRTIPLELGEELFHHAPETKEAWVVPGGGHIQAFWMQTPSGSYPFREQLLWTLNEVTGYSSKLNAIPERPESLELDLPFEAGRSFEVQQGPGGSFSHQGEQDQAVDFAMPEGTPVLAMRGGQVIDVVDQWSEGGPSESLALKANRVVIEHSDGTLAEYLHFKKSGVSVKKGERVARGSRIGISGATGFASDPHLHVRIYTQNGSVPMLFKTALGFTRPLRTGQTITRPKN